MMGKRMFEESPGKERTAKKHLANDGAVGKKKSEAVMKDKLVTPSAKSVAFDQEDEDFPRGGGSALTPAEIRNIQSEAEAEFESEIVKSSNKAKQGKRRLSGADTTEDQHEDTIFGVGLTGKLPNSAEILRHRILCVGMRIWGAIAEVNDRELVISLPGGLRGFVPAEEASDAVAEILKSGKVKKAEMTRKRKIREAGTQTRAESGERTLSSDQDVSDEESEFSLKDIFSAEQLVACTVISLESVRGKGEKKGKSSKRVGLSLRLCNLNEALTIDTLREGSPITACVSSVEDHGYLLSLGVKGLSGFLLHQNCDGDSKLKKGQLVNGVVLSVDKKRGTVNLKTGHKMLASAMMQENEGLSIEHLLPGLLVNARVRAVLRDGLLLSFLTYFNGTVDIFHLDAPLVGSKWAESYAVNQKLKARILYVDPVTKSVGLTINSNLVHHSVPSSAVKTGDLFKGAVVRRVDPTVGLLIELPSEPNASAGYVHISNASDEHIDKLEKKFTEGKKVKARVIGYRMMDGLAVASLKTTVLEQLVSSHTDVKPGMLVNATVVAVEPFGAIVEIGEGLKGLCPLHHMSEFQRSTPSPKFQVGAILKFRVVDVDHPSKKITVTHKKTLVSSKLTPIIRYEDAVEGLVTHGWITGIADYGCFVNFYNDVKGLVHRTEILGDNAATAFSVGQVVKCRVLRSDPSTKRLALSFSTSGRMEDDTEGVAEIKMGVIVSGSVAEIGVNCLVIDMELRKGFTKGVLPFSQLSDNTGHIEQLKHLIKPGHKFERLLVLEKKRRKLVLSAKFSLLQAGFSLPSDVSELQADSVLQGYLANVTAKGCFVRFLGQLTGFATLREVADTFSSNPTQNFFAGQSVRAKILEVNEEKGKFYVSLKQSQCFSTDASLLHGFLMEGEKIFELQSEANGSSSVEWSKELTIGSYVDGEIQDVKDYGVIMNLFEHKDIVGFIAHYQLGDPVEVGTKVRARILDIVKPDGIVDLTIRREVFSPEELTSPNTKKGNLKKRKLNDKSGVVPHQQVKAVVELVKEEYLVLSLPDYGNMIGFASTRDYNLPQEDSHKQFQPGQRLTASIQLLPDESTAGRLLLLLNKSSKAAKLASPKKARRHLKHDVGELVEGEIVSIDPTRINVALGGNSTGSVHITEVWDEFQEGHPFADYKVGQKLTAKVMRNVKSKTDLEGIQLELSVRPSELSGHKYSVASRPVFETVKVGQMFTAYIQVVEDDKAWLLVGPHLRGRLHVLDSSSEPLELQRFRERLKVGHAVRCWVLGKDLTKGTLDLSLREVSPTTEVADKEPQLTVEKGSVLGGRVKKVYPGVGGLLVQIGSKLFGKVHVTHMSDIWVDDPGKKFEIGRFVKCTVLDVSIAADGKLHIDLSLRSSLGGNGGENIDCDVKNRKEDAAVVETLQDISLGQITQAYVKSARKDGCFVILSRSVQGRILIKDLSDTFVADPAESFPPGKVVRGRITILERLSGRVEMSLRTSRSKTSRGEEQDEKHLGHFHIGDVMTCQIKKIATFGLFLTIENSQIDGLCHISEVEDRFCKDLPNRYKVGDMVRAKILKLDVEKKRVTFGLKESYFTSENVGDRSYDAVSGDATDDEVESEEDGENLDMVTTGKDDDYENDEIQDKEDDDIEVLSAITNQKSRSKTSEAVPALQVDLDVESGDEDDNQNAKDGPVEEDVGGSEKQKKRTKKRLKKEREAAIAAAEEKRLKDQGAPETVDEFEQFVRASPNSSFVWIKYMAFMLSIADVDKARAIADRALQTINFREESEKLNVWVAYLNLENAYGNPRKEAVLRVFQKAIQYCDPKKMYLALLGIYERTEQEDMADELLKTMVRKFKSSAKVWLRYIQRALKNGTTNKALDQSLLSLPKRKHLKVITQVSIMEFKQGLPEKGRAIFEGIVRNYPKRLDLWNVYLDQEIRVGDVIVIRALFERAITLELQPKKMKSLFKRYLDFEKTQGDDTRIEYVKAKAMEYVETKLG